MGYCEIALGQDVLVGNQDLLPSRVVSVQTRPRPEYDPLGITVGTFRLFPTLTVDESYDDNVYATDTRPLSDYLTTVSGDLNLQSLRLGSALSASAGFASNRYLHNSVEDYLDFHGTAGYSHFLGLSDALNLTGQFNRAHVARENTGFPQEAVTPPAYDTAGGSVDLRHALAHGNLELNTQLLAFIYYGALLPNHALLSQNFKNRDELTIDFRGNYLVGPSTSTFLRLLHKEYLYKRDSTIGGGTNRDATADTVGGGATFQVTNLMKGEIGVGVLRLKTHSLKNSSQTTLSTLSNIEFYLTPILTATATVERATGAATIIGSDTYISTNATARLDYELRRNLILSTSFTRDYREYTGLNEAETILQATAKARWLLNRSLSLDFSYSYSKRSSPLPTYLGQNYRENIVEAGINLGL